jgi:DNA-binding transcriptional ArsR family regulator
MFLPKEFPERELIRKTFTLREMDLPPNVLMTKKGMIRWFALSFGLISERESRDTILEVLEILFHYSFARGEGADAEEVLARLESKGIKVSDKLVRYHLKRLADLGLFEKKGRRYRFAAAPEAERDDAAAGFRHGAGKNVEASLDRIAGVVERIAGSYKG